jgi:hypothetical protein
LPFSLRNVTCRKSKSKAVRLDVNCDLLDKDLRVGLFNFLKTILNEDGYPSFIKWKNDTASRFKIGFYHRNHETGDLLSDVFFRQGENYMRSKGYQAPNLPVFNLVVPRRTQDAEDAPHHLLKPSGVNDLSLPYLILANEGIRGISEDEREQFPRFDEEAHSNARRNRDRDRSSSNVQSILTHSGAPNAEHTPVLPRSRVRTAPVPSGSPVDPVPSGSPVAPVSSRSHARTAMVEINTRVAEMQEEIFSIQEILDRDDLDEDQRSWYQQSYDYRVFYFKRLLRQMEDLILDYRR